MERRKKIRKPDRRPYMGMTYEERKAYNEDLEKYLPKKDMTDWTDRLAYVFLVGLGKIETAKVFYEGAKRDYERYVEAVQIAEQMILTPDERRIFDELQKEKPAYQLLEEEQELGITYE